MVRRAFLLALGIALGILSSGCMRCDTLVVVNPDGSGRIVEHDAISRDAIEQMEQMVESMARALGDPTPTAHGDPIAGVMLTF